MSATIPVDLKQFLKLDQLLIQKLMKTDFLPTLHCFLIMLSFDTFADILLDLKYIFCVNYMFSDNSVSFFTDDKSFNHSAVMCMGTVRRRVGAKR